MKKVAGLTLILLLAGLFSLAAVPESPEIVRFALVAGCNYGDAESTELKYATSDALKMSDVLSQLGGVSADRQLVLQNPSVRVLDQGFAYMRTVLDEYRGAGKRLELLFYYSGHSDDEGLMLFDEVYTYTQLKDHLEALATDIRVVILDSCYSGAYIRRKGGDITPPFLWGAPVDVEESAVLTSSMAGETSQESDRIQSSFFTHALVSGLRGGADINGDGLISLNEVYEFAFHRTISSTEKTGGGVQHPGYELELSGQGNLILTDIRSTSCRLVLPDPLAGRISVKDMFERVVMEVNRFPGNPLEIGLQPGSYELTVQRQDITRSVNIGLRKGDIVYVDDDELIIVDREATLGRGPAASAQTAPPADDSGIAFALDDVRTEALEALDAARESASGETAARTADSAENAPGADETRDTRTGIVAGLRENAADFRNAVTNLFSGPADRHGLVFSLLGTDVSGSVEGWQVAPINNYTGGRLSGLQLSLGANVVKKEAAGAQISIGANIAAEALRGCQLSSGLNYGGQTLRGAQIAVFLPNIASRLEGVQISGFTGNIADAADTGFQISSFFNVSRQGDAIAQVTPWPLGVPFSWETPLGALYFLGTNFCGGRSRFLQFGGVNIALAGATGAQIALGGSYAADVRGIQLSGVSIARNDIIGAQLAFAAAYAAEVRGVQLSAVNIAPLSIVGAQIGLAGNYTTEIRGAQAGGINIAKQVSGLQIGLVNWSADVDGVQIGLVNIAGNMDGIPIGLININPDSEYHLDFCADLPWYVQNGNGSVAIEKPSYIDCNLRGGGKYSYMRLNFGVHNALAWPGEASAYFSTFAGAGLRLPICPLFTEGSLALLSDVALGYLSGTAYLNTPDFHWAEISSHLVPEHRILVNLELGRRLGAMAGLKTRVHFGYGEEYLPSDRQGLLFNTVTIRDAVGDYPVHLLSYLFFGVQL